MVKPPMADKVKTIASALSCPFLAAKLNNFLVMPELDRLLQAIDSEWGLDRQQFRDERLYGEYCEVLEVEKRRVADIYTNPLELNKLFKLLYQFGQTLSFTKLVTYGELTPLSDLLNIPEIQKAIELAKESLPKGQLLNCFEVIPPGYSLTKANGYFMSAKTASLIRKTFKYTHYSVPDLTKIGFILADEYTEMFLVVDLSNPSNTYITRKKNIGINPMQASITPRNKMKENAGFFIPRRTQGSIFKRIVFREIVGIDMDLHKKAIQAHNEANVLRVTKAHSIPHKQHAPHKPHKPHSQALKYFDEAGLQTTVREYADKHSLKYTTAASRLKKLALVNN